MSEAAAILTARYAIEQTAWLCTLRADGSPHLTPVWYGWNGRAIWVCTSSTSVKVRNLERDPRVSFALEDGGRPLVAEGTATLHRRPYPPCIVGEFAQRYGWDISRPGETGDHGVLVEIAIVRWLLHGRG